MMHATSHILQTFVASETYDIIRRGEHEAPGPEWREHPRAAAAGTCSRRRAPDFSAVLRSVDGGVACQILLATSSNAFKPWFLGFNVIS
jgi:hypothetical protein